MSTGCECGQTRCLGCLGTCPVCGDDIGNYSICDVEPNSRATRLKRMLKGGEGDKER